LGLALMAAFLPGGASAQTLNFMTTNYPAGNVAQGLAVGEFNGDSRLDLAVATNTVDDPADNVAILLGDGQGGFGAPTSFFVGDSPRSIAVADLNGDHKADLAVANSGSETVSVLLGNGSGGFSSPTNFPVSDATRVVIGDFDEDLRLDLAVGTFGGLSVLLGDGSGGFGAPSNFANGNIVRAVTAGDLNHDSHLDLVTATSPYYVSVLLGDGDGGFGVPTNFIAGNAPSAVAIGHFNPDLHPDLAAVNAGGGDVSVEYGDGSGGFPSRLNFEVGSVPNSVAVSDFNMDSRDDLATANTSSNTVTVLLGNGYDWRFGDPSHFSTGAAPNTVAVGDFNGDSRPDLATSNSGSDNVSILLNVAGIPGYPRPKVASPIDVSLVPAYKNCMFYSGGPNRIHGPPLDYPSCSSPHGVSDVTIGTPDANGRPLRAVGKARYDVIAGAPGGADDADVSFALSVNDVRDSQAQQGALVDYTGELQAKTDVRITDRSPPDPRATVVDIFASVTVPCTPTGGPADEGATCAIETSFDAITPGMVPEGKRTVWELGQVKVYDGGDDDDADTCCFEDVFLVQGVFVP
jgi:hypothetical protein